MKCLRICALGLTRTQIIIEIGNDTTKLDLVYNMDTFAKSVTKALMDALQSGADICMIVQCVVGSYLANRNL